MYTDGQPDQAEEEVEHHETDGKLEHSRIHPRRKVVDSDGNDEHPFRDGPDDCSPLHVRIVHIAGKLNLPDVELRDNVICGRLNGAQSG